MIKSSLSQAVGLAVSALFGLLVWLLVWIFVAHWLDFRYLDKILAPVLAFLAGGFSAFLMFTRRLRDIPIDYRGVELFLEARDGLLLDEGIHWIPPFFQVCVVPGPDRKLDFEINGEKITSQDNTVILFGTEGTKNLIQYSITNPIQYSKIEDPELELQAAYLGAARLFFGQTAAAIGAKNAGPLFSNFLLFSPTATSIERDDFQKKLEALEFSIAKNSPAKQALFSPEAVSAIMLKVGIFRTEIQNLGIGGIVAFAPNVREDPAIENAAAKQQAETNQLASARARVAQKIRLTKQMSERAGVSPDLAAVLVAGDSGQSNVSIKNDTLNIPGLTDAISALGTLAINKLASRQGGKP